MPDPENIPVIGPIYRGLTPEELNEIPIFGDVWEGMNAVTNFVEYGCYPHWTVWVDTFLPALGTAILQIISFGYMDILRGYFRPTNVRGLGGKTRVPTRGKRNKPGKTGRPNRIPAIPEVGNEIGKALPGSQFFQGRKVTGWERRIWIVDGFTQRILWYWLVADVGEKFVVNWTTAIMESEACRKPNLGSVVATRPGNQPVIPGTWAAIIAWNTEEDTTDGRWNSGPGTLVVEAGEYAHVVFTCDTGANLPSTNDGNQISVNHNTAHIPSRETSPWPVTGEDDPTETSVACTIAGPIVLQTAVLAYGTGVSLVLNARFSATLYAGSP